MLFVALLFMVKIAAKTVISVKKNGNAKKELILSDTVDLSYPLNIRFLFCTNFMIKGKFELRRGFKIKKRSRVLIVEDVITTGKSSMECIKLIKKAKATHIGFAAIIDRSSKKSLKIKKKIISQLKIDVPTYKKNQLPENLKSIPITTPGSRFIK